MPDEPTPPVDPGNQGDPNPNDDGALGDKGEKALEAWKTRARTAEKEAKRAKELETELQQFRDRDKTEAQKLADAKVAAEKAAADATQSYLRLKIGTSKGLAPDLAERLHGTTEDEMTADADRLLAAIGPRQASKGSADGGARGTAPRGDMSTLIRQAAGRA